MTVINIGAKNISSMQKALEYLRTFTDVQRVGYVNKPHLRNKEFVEANKALIEQLFTRLLRTLESNIEDSTRNPIEYPHHEIGRLCSDFMLWVNGGHPADKFALTFFSGGLHTDKEFEPNEDYVIEYMFERAHGEIVLADIWNQNGNFYSIALRHAGDPQTLCVIWLDTLPDIV